MKIEWINKGGAKSFTAKISPARQKKRQLALRCCWHYHIAYYYLYSKQLLPSRRIEQSHTSMSCLCLFSEEIAIHRESTCPSIERPSKDARSTKSADSVPSTDDESTADESVVSKENGIEVPYVSIIDGANVKDPNEKKQERPKIRSKLKGARRSLRSVYLFQKRVNKSSRMKKLIDPKEETIEAAIVTKVSPEAVVTAMTSPKETEQMTTGIESTDKQVQKKKILSLWEHVKQASIKGPSISKNSLEELSLLTFSDASGPQYTDEMPEAETRDQAKETSNITEEMSPSCTNTYDASLPITGAKANAAYPPPEPQWQGLESVELGIDKFLHDQEKANASDYEQKDDQIEEKDDVDDLISTIFDEFDNDIVEQEIESGDGCCAGVDLPNTAEMAFMTFFNKIDGMNICGCKEEVSIEEGIDPAGEDDDCIVPRGYEVHVELEEDASGNNENRSSGVQSPIDSVDEDSTITATFEEETTLDTSSFDDESLASEYDDFKKAMQLLKNRAAQKGISEGHLLEKIRTEQQRRESLVQLA